MESLDRVYSPVEFSEIIKKTVSSFIFIILKVINHMLYNFAKYLDCGEWLLKFNLKTGCKPGSP